MKGFISYIFYKFVKRVQLSSIKNCKIDKTSRFMSNGLYYNVTIERYSYTGYGCHIVNCKIGSFCSIANNVNIGGATHRMDHVSMSPVFEEGSNVLGKVFYPHPHHKEKFTRIGHDVWIGYGSIIKSGIDVGTGSVIGAGSVVTKSIPPYEVWAGNPAKYIRNRFDKDISIRLLESKWWLKPDTWLHNYGSIFSEPEKLLAKLEGK